ncbi:lipid asymmetry maintenance protein MlaB [Enterobacteriaceae bacterium YMB-R22]|uniref:lipid asymmetry maintenance protein MlaB n=1 Tax=Tenebrionicola larvae TaxID=2815733 RepID=UPI0020127F7C|nr:lipid asymmetry maintenance protein MlaB [Tenebrionicola larvae]MBV4412982.1 lipid asymmetry maintenance protein MlaB [Tenebrionicola larvae]
MTDKLRWQREGDTLRLFDILEYETLEPLWQQRVSATKGVALIDLSAVTRVDTAGLALLVRLVAEIRARNGQARITGISPSLRTLANLYNLPETAFPLAS